MAKAAIPKTFDLKMQTLADLNPDTKLQVLLYGKPGRGKTPFAHCFPNTRTLDFDDGMLSVLTGIKNGMIHKKPEDVKYRTIKELVRSNRGGVEASTALDWACDIVDEWRKEEFDYLIIDSGTALSEFTINKGLDENARLNLSQSRANAAGSGMRVMRMQDWGAGSSLFQNFIDMCRGLEQGLILICHEHEETNDAGTVTGVQPLLIGQLRQRIVKDFDEVWYVDVRRKRIDGEMQNELFLQTSPDSRVVARSRLGLGDELPFDYYAIEKMIQQKLG